MGDGASTKRALVTAFALSLGAAVSLGLARFSYALLLPAMRTDLDWSYLTAGAMNTVNAAGYFVGALLATRWLRRHPARRVLLAGSTLAAVALVAHGWVAGDATLYALRFVAGLGSAATFIAGGLLAARLASAPAGSGPALHAGLALGIYYGGAGLGIVASAVFVPLLADPTAPHGWQAGWIGLGVAALVATAAMGIATRDLDAQAPGPAHGTRALARGFAFALAAYFLFGLGYIGYMTFVITLLRELHLSPALVTGFYVALGVAVFSSPWLWARLLHRRRDGMPLALLNALLAVATLLPVLSADPVAIFASGLLFGAVFLSVVASTTALVRHNLAPAAWPAGIALFTAVFAAGQVVGPALIGLVADATGGLRSGFAVSAGVLALASFVAWRQKPSALQ